MGNQTAGDHRLWAVAKGPREKVTARVTPDAAVTLTAASALYGVSRSALVAQILERWAGRWLDESLHDVKQAVEAERGRRET